MIGSVLSLSLPLPLQTATLGPAGLCPLKAARVGPHDCFLFGRVYPQGRVCSDLGVVDSIPFQYDRAFYEYSYFTNRIVGTYHLVQYVDLALPSVSPLLSIICKALLSLNKDVDSNTVFSIEKSKR